MLNRIAFALAFVLAPLLLATEVLAGPKIVAPPLPVPPGGDLYCVTANTSDTKTIEYILRIYDLSATMIAEDEQVVGPHETAGRSEPAGDFPSYCTVEVTSGPKKELHVTLNAMDSSGTVQASVVGR